MTTSYYTHNGFYQDPTQPQGFRLLRINKDAGVMLYGKDRNDSKVWCVRGIITSEGVIKLNNTDENPSMAELEARLEDGRIVWHKTDKAVPFATWQKKSMRHHSNANTVFEKPMPKRLSMANQLKVMLHKKIKHHLLQQPIVMQSIPGNIRATSTPYYANVSDCMLLLVSLAATLVRSYFC